MQCRMQPDGSLKVTNVTREFAECVGSNGRTFELDINRTECMQIEPGRKRADDYACPPTTAVSGAASQQTLGAGVIVFTLLSTTAWH